MTAFILVALLGVAGLLLSLSFIELAHTELQAATDAAARSAVIRLAISQSEEEGRSAASQIAGRYRVAGQPFSLVEADVTFGNSTPRRNGRFRFEPNRAPLNAVQVLGRKTQSSSAGPVALPFGSFVGRPNYNTERYGAAMRLDYDIVLVLDRSGSMGWDLSHRRFSYPPSKDHRPVLEKYFSPPDAIQSRWGVLSASVDTFLDVLAERDVSSQVALVTFASDYEFGAYQSQRVTIDSDFTENFASLSASIHAIGEKPLIGATDIAAGLSEAEALLISSPKARVRTAHPTVILFSDGIFTLGDDPVELAQSMYESRGVVIHSITFGAEESARQTMDEVAAAAGRGLSLHAESADDLLESFRQIANSIPVIVIQ